MVTAIVLINIGHGSLSGIAKEIGAIPEVAEVHSVAGPYDLIVKVQVEEYERMAEVIADKLGNVDGIRDTTTLMAFRTYKF
ncbi:MAG: Lrp/AsnC ligand binding domain-containing protein [Frankiaceae bacterium]|nr:Lrp/AsnC ligand binding domain-containing protein [Frankiaceae bacterium]